MAEMQIEAKRLCDAIGAYEGPIEGHGAGEVVDAWRALSAAVKLPDPRPDDMGELARLTAIELRKRGIWAERSFPTTGDGYSVRVPYQYHEETRFTWYSMFGAIFNNLGPRECADEIQRQEVQRAKEWAGDT